jgi:hypothetical protein
VKRDVHLYALVRVKVVGIESDSYDEAMEKASALDLHALLDSSAPGAFVLNNGLVVNHVAYAEEISGYLVDEPGEDDGVAYDMHGKELSGDPGTCSRCGR